MPTTSSLTVMDKITEPILPELDPSLLDFQPMDLDFGDKDDNPLNWTSQLQSDPISVEKGRGMALEQQLPLFDEDEVEIDLDLDLDLGDGTAMDGTRKDLSDASSEHGFAGTLDRDVSHAPLALDDDDINRQPRSSEVPSLEDDQGNNADHLLPLEDDPILPVDDAALDAGDTRTRRDSQSPLSSARSSVVRNFDETNLGMEEDDEEPSIHQAPQRAKRRKIIHADRETVLPTAVIKAQQEHREAILKPASFLPRDPLLLNLMTMQKNGDFVSSALGMMHAKGFAPELQDLLSIDTVRKASELKRKRDSGVTDMGSDDVAPQLEIPEDQDFADEGLAMPAGDDDTRAGTMIDLPPEDLPVVNEGIPAIEDDDMAPIDQFEDTTAPLVHPIDQGPVSLGTQHAVHLLRDRFGGQPSPSKGTPSQHHKASVLFQDMLPESTSSKADATKMFFEVLVLATKDAVKVEQKFDDLGGPLRIRGKRGLWGAWAEREAGGEIEGQEIEATV